MLYMPKIADYLKILTDEVVYDFVVINYEHLFWIDKIKIF